MRPLLVVLALAAAVAASAPAVAADRPNVILVIGDDHGWPYYGFQESPQILTNGQNVQDVVQTPSLDELAATGVTFTRGYATGSVCAASLQTLLSAHGHEWSQWTRLRDEVRRTVPTTLQERLERRENRYADNLPRTLGRHGYRTWQGGKMSAGLFSDAGFHEGMATYMGGPPFFLSGGSSFGRENWNVADCGSTAVTETPCPALEPFRGFLDGVGDQPFFAWFAPALPHYPWNAPAEYRAPFEAAGLWPYEVDHLSNIRWFDELLGELLIELDRRGLREDTLLIYASDNGWGMGFQFLAGSGRGKGTLYDLGFRTPIIVNQPGVVPDGVEYDDFVSTSDLSATILDYAGAPIPPHSVGTSLRARIEGGAPIGRAGLVMFHPESGGAWVDDQWRYLLFNDGREELYRIDIDPFERTNLAAQHPERVSQYRPVVEARRRDLVTFPDVVEISGQVRDAEGGPIAGGRIDLKGGPRRVQALTGDGGWFRLAGVDASATLSLQASRGLRRSILLDAAEDAPIADPFRLPGLFHPLVGTARRPVARPLGGGISGRVLTPAGAPLPGAGIRVFARLPGTNLALETISQSDGVYAFENLAVAAGYRLRASALGHRTRRVAGLDIADTADRLHVDLVLEPR